MTPRRARLVTAALAAVVLVPGAVVLSHGGYPVRDVAMRYGSVWLTSTSVGQLTLVDGVSAAVVTAVGVGRPGDALAARQVGADGYVVNPADGVVTRIDGATETVTRTRTLFTGAGKGLRLMPSSAALYGADLSRGLLLRADPRTLAPSGPPLAAGVRADQTVVDANGRLWALDGATGTLSWYAGGEQGSRAEAADAGRGVLALAGGRPALVDVSARRAGLVAPGSGTLAAALTVDVQPDDEVVVTGSATGERVLDVVVPSRGVLLECSFDRGRCGDPVGLGGPRTVPGIVRAGERVFVPDVATGEVLVVDPAGSRVVASPAVLPAGARFELVEQGGFVFFNEPAGPAAGVIGTDGSVRRVLKYERTPRDADPETGRRGDGRERAREPTPTPTPTTTPTAPDPVRTGTPATTSPPDGEGPAGEATSTPGGGDPTGPGTEPGPGTPTGPGGGGGTVTLAVTVRPGLRQPVHEPFAFTVHASSGARVSDVRWTFGDGRTGTGTAVSHAYGSPGRFAVTVRASVAGVDDPLTARTRVTADAPVAGNVHCGEVLTESVVLNVDLDCGEGTAIRIGAEGVVLDLDGHTIRKRDDGLIFDSSHQYDAAIRNGILQGGALSWGYGDLALSRVNLRGTGVNGLYGRFELHDSVLSDASLDITKIVGSIADTTFIRADVSVRQSSGGAPAYEVRDNTFVESVLRPSGDVAGQNRFENSVVSLDQGFGGSASVMDSVFTGPDSGIVVETRDGTRYSGDILRNRFTGSRVGIRGSGASLDSNQVSDNVFTDVGVAGILFDGISAVGLGELTISGNRFVRSGHSSHGTEDSGGNAVDDAIHVYAPAARVVIAGNETSRSADHGIEARGDIVDGGGNVSRDDPAGCLGVTCD